MTVLMTRKPKSPFKLVLRVRAQPNSPFPNVVACEQRFGTAVEIREIYQRRKAWYIKRIEQGALYEQLSIEIFDNITGEPVYVWKGV